jgi:hypothetical protein
MNMTRKAAASQPQHYSSRVPPTHSDCLWGLARQVERLGISGRTDPEAIVLVKLAIAGELRELARAIGR